MEDERLDATDRWFAANLKAARDRAGLSQEAVAARMREAGFPRFRQQTIARIETGERAVRVGEGLVLARACRSDIGELARPPDAMRDATVLRGATARLRQVRGEVAAAVRSEAEAQERLAALVASLREAGKAGGLSAELAEAEKVLGESATLGDEGREDSRPVTGPPEATGRSEVT
jgi:transcriptional regulator with XRE-family HTH domain